MAPKTILQIDFFASLGEPPPEKASDEKPLPGKASGATRRPPPAPVTVAVVAPAPLPPPPAPSPIEGVSGASAAAVLSVSELTFLLKGAVENRFSKVSVLGEVSNCRRQASGHLYFTLKDDAACVAAVMWRREAQRLPFEVRDGLQLVCQGRIEIYGPHGKYQLIVDRLEPVGAGALALAFADLKGRLEKEGLFDPRRKRRLPLLPRRIGVVTSPTGAALRDFLRVLHVRFPGLPVLIAPARVQGEGAAREVLAGMRRLAAQGVDLVVLTRGGGSMEDLWAFNDEALARAIAASPVPVVSAIGHEIDFTIADFVADKRAPTPSGAAEMLAPVRQDLLASLAVAGQRLGRGLAAGVQRERQRLLKLQMRLGDPRRQMTERRMALGGLEDRLSGAMQGMLTQRAQLLRQLAVRVQRRSPAEVLARRLRELHALRVGMERAATKVLAIETRKAELARQAQRLQRAVQSDVRTQQERLRLAHARLETISPQRVFERGYSLTRAAASQAVVRKASDVAKGEVIEVTLQLREREGDLVEEKVTARVE